MSVFATNTKFVYHAKKVMGICISLFILGLGVSCFYKAGLGSDPISCFIDGIHNIFNVSYGFATFIYNFSAFLIIAIVNRKLIRAGTIFYTFFVGIFVNITGYFLDVLLIDNLPIYIRAILLIFGTVLLGVGTGSFIWLDIGMGVADVIATSLSRLLKISYTSSRVSLDIAFTVCGYVLGGVVGIGSIVGMFATGFIISATISVLNKIRGK